MPQLDNHKVETLFNLPHENWDEESIPFNPFLPDPLLLTAEQIADILRNFNEI